MKKLFRYFGDKNFESEVNEQQANLNFFNSLNHVVTIFGPKFVSEALPC